MDGGWMDRWRMDGWMDGWRMDGWMEDGWIDGGWMDGWIDGLINSFNKHDERTYVLINIPYPAIIAIQKKVSAIFLRSN